jgi:hypothetical protein
LIVKDLEGVENGPGQGVIALCLLLAMALVFITRRKYGPETLWLLAGGVLVAGTSIVVP